MLPVITGFIFPDGTILETGAQGHCKCAFQYIREHNLLDDFLSSRFDSEDDFLVAYLGAIKVCHYIGRHYIYVPRPHGHYISSMEKLYKEAGYKVQYFSSNTSEEIKIKVIDLSKKSYNQTIVETDDGYIYNPRRIGD